MSSVHPTDQTGQIVETRPRQANREHTDTNTNNCWSGYWLFGTLQFRRLELQHGHNLQLSISSTGDNSIGSELALGEDSRPLHL
jgi:hypothetical protein